MDILSFVQKVAPEFRQIEVASLEFQRSIVGWESSVISDTKEALGGGVSVEKEIAIQISVSECLERKLFSKLDLGSWRELKVDEFPTSCGFAFGFEEHSTKERSLFEALERWSWSKWIDEGCSIPRSIPDLSPLSKYFQSHFDEVLFFERRFNFQKDILSFIVSIGLNENGAFAGSRVGHPSHKHWEHALSESWRHLLRFKAINPLFPLDQVDSRLKFFGENGSSAIEQVNGAKNKLWPYPELLIHTRVKTPFENLYLFRSLIKNYKSWHLGGDSRFVY